MQRREFFNRMLAGVSLPGANQLRAQWITSPPFVERAGANYNNHRMSDISRNELICRLIFLIRYLKIDTVFCYDPWAHDEENPDHYVPGHCVEAASWMAGRVHDYPEQIDAGFAAHAVTDKYYYARRPEITRVVDITSTVENKIDANLCHVAKGPGGHHGSKLRTRLAREGKKLLLLGDDDRAADRNYIREFVLAPNREPAGSMEWSMRRRSTTSART